MYVPEADPKLPRGPEQKAVFEPSFRSWPYRAPRRRWPVDPHRIERDGSIDVRCDSGHRRAEELAPSFGESLERVQVTTQTVTPLTYGIGSTTVLASVSPNRLTMRLTFSRLSVMNVDGRMRKPSWPSTANLLLSDAPPWTYSKLTVAWMA